MATLYVVQEQKDNFPIAIVKQFLQFDCYDFVYRWFLVYLYVFEVIVQVCVYIRIYLLVINQKHSHTSPTTLVSSISPYLCNFYNNLHSPFTMFYRKNNNCNNILNIRNKQCTQLLTSKQDRGKRYAIRPIDVTSCGIAVFFFCKVLNFTKVM